MGLFRFLAQLFFPRKGSAQTGTGKRRLRPKLVPRRHSPQRHWKRSPVVRPPNPAPYAFARRLMVDSSYLDLSLDTERSKLDELGLPVLNTPLELAEWFHIRLGRLAWLVHRFNNESRPPSEKASHYHYTWKRKRTGGFRLIESPKKALKSVQTQILREILDRMPPHPAAHGFWKGRSITSNAKPHVGQAVVVKLDLLNFYATISFARVTAIFRAIGYSRESAIWLARLTTSGLPRNIPFLKEDPSAVLPYLRRHLPQGAPTSPAIANLSAYRLDVRLSGLAKSFGAKYTRYADDLTFSGPETFARSLRTFIPLARQVIRQERFRTNAVKRAVLRRMQRMAVTGVVVNDKLNVRRDEFDRLKATLFNCMKHGPSTQNRERHADFAAHLRGRVAHVQQLNRRRGDKLLALYQRIDWSR